MRLRYITPSVMMPNQSFTPQRPKPLLWGGTLLAVIMFLPAFLLPISKETWWVLLIAVEFGGWLCYVLQPQIRSIAFDKEHLLVKRTLLPHLKIPYSRISAVKQGTSPLRYKIALEYDAMLLPFCTNTETFLALFRSHFRSFKRIHSRHKPPNYSLIYDLNGAKATALFLSIPIAVVLSYFALSMNLFNTGSFPPRHTGSLRLVSMIVFSIWVACHFLLRSCFRKAVLWKHKKRKQ